MVRTQIYLTNEEQEKLRGISAQTNRPQSELIREAIDLYVVRHLSESRNEILRKAKGIWKNRKDTIDLNQIRRELDRY